MESGSDNRHEGTNQNDDNDRTRMSATRLSPASTSLHTQNEEQDPAKVTIRKAQREEYRRKRSKINYEEQNKDANTGLSTENDSMEGSDIRGEQITSIKEIRAKTRAVLRCIELAYSESVKKAPPAYDKDELHQFMELLERKNVLQLEKNLMLAEQNLCLAEQALYLSNNTNKDTGHDNENESGAKKLYSEILMKENTTKIQGGVKLPIPVIPSLAKHFPSDRVVIIKSNNTGRTLTDNELRRGKDKICRLIGNLLALEILVIRTTRSGGYVVVLKSPAKREEIKTKLISDEVMKDRVVLPKAKLPKVICKNVTEEFSIEELQRDLYSWKNQKLQSIPTQERVAKVIQTRLGLVMELSSMEIMAIELQDWRIRYGYGNEIKVEEFIPIQQCYNCSCFGHSADNCKNMPRCRLCASSEHSGRDCNKRTDRTQWKCTNCLDSNLRKNTKLNCSHGAAQLHKCQIALNEREIKRQQMANEGIYVSNNASGRPATIQRIGNSMREVRVKPTDQKAKEVIMHGNVQYEEDTRNLYMENEKRNKNSLTKVHKRTENEHERKKANKELSESESEIENEEKESELTKNNAQKNKYVRSIQSQRRGFGQVNVSDEGGLGDAGWSTQRRGRSKIVGRQRSASRIRRSGMAAKPQYHTRSTTSLGEELLAYSPIKRREAIRRGRPARNEDVTNDEEVYVDAQNKRMTPRSEGYGVRLGRIGGYVDRRGGSSHKESDEAMSMGDETAGEGIGKDRNER